MFALIPCSSLTRETGTFPPGKRFRTWEILLVQTVTRSDPVAHRFQEPASGCDSHGYRSGSGRRWLLPLRFLALPGMAVLLSASLEEFNPRGPYTTTSSSCPFTPTMVRLRGGAGPGRWVGGGLAAAWMQAGVSLLVQKCGAAAEVGTCLTHRPSSI